MPLSRWAGPKNSLETVGLISDKGYTSVGDPYDKRAELKPDREKGKQLQAGCGKGKRDKDFTYFAPMAVGEKYSTWLEQERRHRNEQAKQNVAKVPFRCSSPPPKHPYFGTITRFKHEADFVEGKGPREKVQKVVPRQISTSPPKMGSFGVPGTHIGVYGQEKKFGNRGAFGEYAYVSTPYVGGDVFGGELARKIAREEKKKQEKISKAPFYPAKPPKKGTYGFPGREMGEKGLYTYEAGKEGPQKENLPAVRRPNTAEGIQPQGSTASSRPQTSDGLKPFIPANPPPKHPYFGTITQHGYQSVPYIGGDVFGGELSRKLAKEAKAKDVALTPFKPFHVPKSIRTPSIADHPIKGCLNMSWKSQTK
jgi:hypothetical protein